MYGSFITIHVFICIGLMISILMQSAKGEGLAGAFGGSSLTGTVFGGRGAAPFLAKATSGLAVAFMSSCILLTFISPVRQTTATGTPESAVEQAARERADEIPMQQPVAIPTDQFPVGDESAQPTDQQAAPPAGETPPPTGEDEPGGQ